MIYSDINWKKVTHKVGRLQNKILKAFLEGNMDLVYRLQSTLIESLDGRLPTYNSNFFH